MTQATTETQDSAALLVGARGAIGKAMQQELLRRGLHAKVYGSTRSLDESTEDLIPCDFLDPAGAAQCRQQLAERLMADGLRLGGIYFCSGVLHGPAWLPERRLADLKPDSFLQIMQINALGLLALLAELLPLLPRRQLSRVAAISARIGSISDNRLGGWHSYRCSKAALNMGMKNAAIELARSHPACRVTLFHPGTVDSPLSRPFQAGLPPGQLFTAERAAWQFCEVLQARDHGEGPMFLDWAGKEIAF